MKKILALVIAAGLLTFCAGAVTGTPEVNAPSVLLMEAGTGKVLYEENADKELSIASITKVMTLLLVCEALEAGTVRMDQKVTVSTRASQMGGSQIYLKEGEVMPFEDLLKSVIISSANDSAVALGELVAGSESAFIQRMNNRAKELGMENTCFLNCTGLSAPGHYSSARDVARMSRELLRHDVIRKYSTVWMDSVRNGEFGLTNTNKLVKTYTGITGLKTGFTSDAGFCVSASAMRDGMELIAVVLGAATSAQRFETAASMLDFGFANWALVDASEGIEVPDVPVVLGREDHVRVRVSDSPLLLVEKERANRITSSLNVAENVSAPVAEGRKLGELVVTDGEEVLLSVDLVASGAVGRMRWADVFVICLKTMFCADR